MERSFLESLFPPQRRVRVESYLQDILSDVQWTEVVEVHQELATILSRSIPADDVSREAAFWVSLFPHSSSQTIPHDLCPSPVREIVMGAQRILRLEAGSMEYQLESFIRLILNISDDPRTILVVLAEQLRLMRIFSRLSSEKQHHVLLWVHTVFTPIAHRLGLYTVKTELEERWLKYSDYETYRSIADKLEAKKDEREAFIRRFIAPIRRIMKKNNISCEIKGRSKSIYSIWKKMQKQNVDVDGIYDKFAIRIIITDQPREKEKEMCWKVYSLVTEKYRPFPKRLRDWISYPKSSGYESLHITVVTEEDHWVEVQIRTDRMDYIAENGHAAHWRYKEGGARTGDSDQIYLAQMRSALEHPDALEHAAHGLKDAFYSRDLYVFTPADELVRLRARATVLDFAFAIHSDLGFRCTGARVNGVYVSIREELKTGDVVEVLTSKKQHPTQEWLEFVQSPSALSRIKRYLREQEHRHAEEGREIIRRKFKALAVPLTDATLRKLCDAYNCEDTVELYDRVGEKKIDLLSLKKSFFAHDKDSGAGVAAPKESRFHGRQDNSLVIDNALDQVQFTLSKCCNPVRGDEVFGFITVNKGVTIHRMDCPNAAGLFKNAPHRIVSARWKEEDTARFLKELVLYCSGENEWVISQVTKRIKLTPQVRLIKIHMNDSLTPGVSTVELSLEVPHADTFTQIVEEFRRMAGIGSVYLP
ncbi:RelA/SpoT family protein [Chitinivibrio alkaliphilus]|nr:TGS domain-containing protein [Chitinivibrio alkaliphilus]